MCLLEPALQAVVLLTSDIVNYSTTKGLPAVGLPKACRGAAKDVCRGAAKAWRRGLRQRVAASGRLGWVIQLRITPISGETAAAVALCHPAQL